MVGYQQIEIPNVDLVLFTPTFKGVGGGLDLTTIKIVDETGAEFDPYDAISVQVMDNTGAYTDYYSYSPAFYSTGWGYNGADVNAGDVVIDPGEAFCVNNASGQKVFLVVNGEVDLINKNYVPNQDYVLWGNSTPISIDITDIKLVDAEGNEFDPFDSVSLQVMDETGAYTEYYSYSPAFYTYGWSNSGTEVSPTEFVIKPGQSFCVNNASGQDFYIKLPKPTTYTLPVAE